MFPSRPKMSANSASQQGTTDTANKLKRFPSKHYRSEFFQSILKTRIFLVVTLIYSIFFSFLLIQHKMIFLQHDDFGYSVLHYTTEQKGFSGQEFSLVQVLAFIKNEYLSWTGRLASHFLHIYAQKIGLGFVQFFQSILITTISLLFFGISHTEIHRTRFIYLALFSTLLYIALPIGATVGGVYWFTASSVHLWGAPFFLAGIYVLKKKQDLSMLSILFFSFAALFSEQMAIAVLSCILILCKWKFIHTFKRCIPIFLMASITIFSPGNFNRMKAMSDTNAGLTNALAGISDNFESIAINLFFPSEFNIFSIFVLLGILNLILFLLSARKTGMLIWIAFAIQVAFLLISSMQEMFQFAASLSSIISFSLLFFLVARESRFGRLVICMHVAAIASLTPLLFAPGGIPSRALLPFLILEFLPLAYAIVILTFQRWKYVETVVVLVFGILVFCSARNAFIIFEGYHSNYEIHYINHAQLRVESYLQRNTMNSKGVVRLFKLRDRRFSEVQPYERPLIEVWMKKYYRLDADTQFIWE